MQGLYGAMSEIQSNKAFLITSHLIHEEIDQTIIDSEAKIKLENMLKRRNAVSYSANIQVNRLTGEIRR